MLKKIQIRNLPESIAASDLEDLLSTVGNVISASVGPGSRPGTLIGIVEMSTSQEAADCIDRFNGKAEFGTTLVVVEDKPHVPNAKRSGGRKGLPVPGRKRDDKESKELSARIRAAIIASRN